MLIEKPLEFNGKRFVVCCQDHWEHPSNWSHTDEDIVRQRVWKNIKPGDIVFDVGAAYGSYGLTALAQGAAHVYGWSPQRHPGDEMSEADYLRKTLTLNGWSNKWTIWEHSGVYSETGWYDTTTAAFAKDLAGPPGSWVLRVQAIDDLKMEDGSDFIWPEKIDIWKMDVEGAEAHVLRGATKTIARYRPRMICVENHNFLIPDMEKQIADILIPWGWRHDHTVQHGSVSHSLWLAK